MDLNVLRTFVAVCEYSGFSAAGERLGYTQSTVSSQIRQLEKELNVALFDRFYHRHRNSVSTSSWTWQGADRLSPRPHDGAPPSAFHGPHCAADIRGGVRIFRLFGGR